MRGLLDEPARWADHTVARLHARVPVARAFPDRRNTVLMYHSVADEGPMTETYGNVSPARFERDLRYLQATYDVVPLGEVLETIGDDETKVALTFDDGFRNFHTEVLPLLEAYDAPATVFVNPRFVGNEDLETLAKRHRWSTVPDEPVLSDAQLWDLLDHDLVTVGNHTLTHPDLRDLSRAEQRYEILGGKEVLESEYGARVTQFSYPYGFYEDATTEVVADTHDLAVTTAHELVRASTDATTVPRIHAHEPHAYLRWKLLDGSWDFADRTS